MASSSKLLALTLSCPLLRSSRLASSFLPPGLSRCLPGPFFSSAHFCSAAAAAEPTVDDAASAAVAVASTGHPWPVWGDFLDKLRAKGYFERAPPSSSAGAAETVAVDGEAAAAGDDTAASGDPYPFRDLNRVKNACLKFGRERFDLLSALPKHDIQAIVECGCPNIYRKAVNSAKRLREFVQVDEGDACSVCKLRGSCDKAYVIPKAEEGARTVDVVRILLTFAIDPTSLSGANPVAGSVQESAKELLSKLIMLSDTTIDPSLPKPVFQTSSKREPLSKHFDKGTQSVANSQGSAGKGRETTATEMRNGDWLCPKCSFLNFARNHRCLECKESGPKKVEAATTEMKPGDWICPQCHFMNFARNKMCFKCEESRPKRQLNPGEWECPKCEFINFRRNQLCLRCNHDRPEDDAQNNQVRQGAQRNVERADKSRSFGFVGCEDSDEDAVDVSQYEGERKHAIDRRAEWAQRRISRKSRSPEFIAPEADSDEDVVDVLPYEQERKHAADRRVTGGHSSFDGKKRSPDFACKDDDSWQEKGERKHEADRRVPAQARTSFFGKRSHNDDDVLACERDRKHVADRTVTRARPSSFGKGRRPDFADQDDDDTLSYEGERKHVGDRGAAQARKSSAGKGRRPEFASQDDDDTLPYEGERKHAGDRRAAQVRKSSAGKGRRPDSVGQDDDNALPYEGESKHVGDRRAAPAQARKSSAGKGRRGPGFAGPDDGDEDNDVLPYEGERKHVATKRATPVRRSFTAARSR